MGQTSNKKLEELLDELDEEYNSPRQHSRETTIEEYSFENKSIAEDYRNGKRQTDYDASWRIHSTHGLASSRIKQCRNKSWLKPDSTFAPDLKENPTGLEQIAGFLGVFQNFKRISNNGGGKFCVRLTEICNGNQDDFVENVSQEICVAGVDHIKLGAFILEDAGIPWKISEVDVVLEEFGIESDVCLEAGVPTDKFDHEKKLSQALESISGQRRVKKEVQSLDPTVKDGSRCFYPLVMEFNDIQAPCTFTSREWDDDIDLLKVKHRGYIKESGINQISGF